MPHSTSNNTPDSAEQTNSGAGAPLLTPRAALVLLLAVLVGIGAGLLTAWAGTHPGLAITAGAGAFAAAVVLGNTAIGS